MGVPVVTLSGQTSASRFGESLLRQAGLQGLIAYSVESYIQLAISLARDGDLRYELRKDLRETMARSHLCDEKGFVESMENAYRRVWEEWCGKRNGVSN